MGFMMMTDAPETAESNKIPVSEAELNTVDLRLQVIELNAVNRMLVGELWGALEFRGLMAALFDPLALDSQKREYRERWKKIELGIRAAIERADSLNK